MRLNREAVSPSLQSFCVLGCSRTIKPQPRTNKRVTFYNRVKDQLRAQGAEALGNAIRIENSDPTEQDLIAILEDVNEEKRAIGEL